MELTLGKALTGRPFSRSASRTERLARRVSGALTPPMCAAAAAAAVAAHAGTAAAWGWASLLIAVGVLLPTGYTLYLHRSGQLSDLHMNVRRERRRPLAASAASAAAALGLLWAGGAGPLPTLVAAVWTAQSLLFFGVTLRWKISAHCAGCAGLAVLCGWLYGSGALGLLALVPLVAWSRVFLRRHTLGQTLAGTAAGCVTWLLALAGLPAL